MGCGCKNKQSSPQPVQGQTTQSQINAQVAQTTQSSTNVQENIRKVIEKYYTTKK